MMKRIVALLASLFGAVYMFLGIYTKDPMNYAIGVFWVCWTRMYWLEWELEELKAILNKDKK